MILPERGKLLKSFRLSKHILQGAIPAFLLFALLGAILAYDYKQILDQIYQNKHLAVENRKLKEQLSMFQLKMDSLHQDLKRIDIFEKKLRVITGLDEQLPFNEDEKKNF